MRPFQAPKLLSLKTTGGGLWDPLTSDVPKSGLVYYLVCNGVMDAQAGSNMESGFLLRGQASS